MVRDEIVDVLRNEHSLGRGWEYTAADRILAMKAAETPVAGEAIERLRTLCKAFNMHGSFADNDDEPMLRAYLRNIAGLSDYQIDTTLLAMSSKADDRWQPIETAPVDEQVMFGYFGPDEGWRGFLTIVTQFQWECMEAPLASGWPAKTVKPTHWHPLPEPPASLTMESGDGR